jgi:hypothetical protein
MGVVKYEYELWNGKRVVGFYKCDTLLAGKCVVQLFQIVRNDWSREYVRIEVPITTRVITNDGITYTSRIVLDVRKKSARQRALLSGTL